MLYRMTGPDVDVGARLGNSFSDVDLEVIDRLLSTTRSVRRRLDLERPVDPAIVLECLRLAVQAPAAGNVEAWRWMVITDPDTRRQIADIYRRAGLDWLDNALRTADSDQERRVYESAIHLAQVLEHVPIHVIPCIVGRIDPAQPGMAADVLGSVIPAAWSFMLALRSRGLGSAWTTIHLANEGETRTLLGIPDDVTQVALLPVAHTIGTHFRPARRRPAEQVTFWNTWGQTEPAPVFE
jgi:nitroreductase